MSQPWGCIAITLDKDGKRYKSFLENNRHLNISTFVGVRGQNLSKKDIISRGLATEDFASSSLFSYGAIGCAASHKAIWDNVAKSANGYFVLEDDCYTHPEISDYISTNIEVLMRNDIHFFGINTNSVMKSISPSGLTHVSLFNPQHPSRKWIKNSFSKTNISYVERHKLIKAFGTCAYFVSPHGAKNLIQQIFPLSLKTTKIPLISDQMPSISIDRSGCRIYQEIDAFVCQPFLAYTPNLDSNTKI